MILLASVEVEIVGVHRWVVAGVSLGIFVVVEGLLVNMKWDTAYCSDL